MDQCSGFLGMRENSVSDWAPVAKGLAGSEEKGESWVHPEDVVCSGDNAYKTDGVFADVFWYFVG